MAYVPRLGYKTVERIILENRGDPGKVRKALEDMHITPTGETHGEQSAKGP
jgi:hypothetical protein